MKIYRFNIKPTAMCIVGETVNFKPEDSIFSREEIDSFLNGTNIKYYDITEEIGRRDNYSKTLKGLEKYIELETSEPLHKITDIINTGLTLGPTTLLLTEKAKKYIEKRYGDKMEFLKLEYKRLPIYLMNVLPIECCFNFGFKSDAIDYDKISGTNDIFRIKEIDEDASLGKFSKIGIFCNENFKKYIEESDLTGYEFIEMKDIKDIKEEKEENIEIKEVEVKEYYSNGVICCEGTLWNGHRIKNWKFYYPNGQIEADINFMKEELEGCICGELDGEWKEYYENGKLKEEGRYIIGRRVGKFVKYDEEGNEISEEEYKVADNASIYEGEYKKIELNNPAPYSQIYYKVK